MSRRDRIQPLIDKARAALRAGQGGGCERAARKALDLLPGDAEALFLLGMGRLLGGQLGPALAALRQAVARDPDAADAQFGLALAAERAGEPQLALDSLRRAVALRPGFATALATLSRAELARGAVAEAEALARRACDSAPDLAGAHNALGNALAAQARWAEAEPSFRRALRLDASLAPAHDNLGQALLAQGRTADAIASFRRALAEDADYAPAQLHLAEALRAAGQSEAALVAFATAARLQPDHADLRASHGHALTAALRPTEAEASYRAALARQPAHATALHGLGTALLWQHRLAEARAAYRAAAAARPGWTSPLFHDAVAALLAGDYAEGLAGYEHRADHAALAADRAPRATPRWRGDSDPAGRTVLLHDEQGFGDSLMFARYAPLLAARGARVVLELRPELLRLLGGMDGVAQAVARGQSVPHDLHCPLPSLPLAFGTTRDSVPAELPYLHADPALTAQWRQALAGDGKLVALAWAGNPEPPHRAMPLAALTRLFARPGLRFVSVQKPVSEADAAVLAAHPAVRRLDDALQDFADTAAVLAAADLTISVDTAVAHLAGALGRPLWVALGFLPDWRWGLHGGTPWYPQARLFRQPAAGDWETVAAALDAALATFV